MLFIIALETRLTRKMLEVDGMDKESYANLNIVDAASRVGVFTRFISLLEGSVVEQKLRQGSSFTLFAPTDNAFKSFSPLTLNWLIEADNGRRLSEILSYHLVRGPISSKQLERMKSAKTELGQELQIDLFGNLLINSARLVLCDIEASNGFIHGISKLLIPRACSQLLIRAQVHQEMPPNQIKFH